MAPRSTNVASLQRRRAPSIAASCCLKYSRSLSSIAASLYVCPKHTKLANRQRAIGSEGEEQLLNLALRSSPQRPVDCPFFWLVTCVGCSSSLTSSLAGNTSGLARSLLGSTSTSALEPLRPCKDVAVSKVDWALRPAKTTRE